MFFLNLTAAEFLGLLGVLGGAITALYFLDRSKRRKVVSTLQFWASATAASEQRSRKKVNQPWSLLLQLVSLALLLLAIAQLQWGTRTAPGRNHVVLIDTSAWSAARSSGGENVLQAELIAAAQFVASIPAQDRVLIARADALTAPATVFTADREQLRTALGETVSSSSSLDLPGALAYAEQAQRWSGSAAGDIVYIGPQRVESESVNATLPRNLRILSVPVSGANCGIRRVDVRRGEADSTSWHAQITLFNYSKSSQQVRLRTQFAGTRFAVRTFKLSPLQETTTEYNFVTNIEGQLSAELEGQDVLPQDNRAFLRLPGNNNYAVTVFTRRAELFRPLLSSDRRIAATYLDPSSLSGSLPKMKPIPDLIIFDGVPYAGSTSIPCIWINVPAGGSPFAVKEVVAKGSIKSWNSSALMAAGLHAREQSMPQAKTFRTQTGDVTLASLAGQSSEGPVVLLRSNAGTGPKMAAIGFDPLDAHLRFTLTTPLLFANLLEWMAPEAARAIELRAGRVGSAAVTLEPEEIAATLRVTGDSGIALPFTVHERTLQLFVDKPTVVHIVSATRERVLSLTLPDVASAVWTPSASDVRNGLPPLASIGATALDLWQWLACVGAAGLLIEWLLFGRARIFRRATKPRVATAVANEQRDEDLVAQ